MPLKLGVRLKNNQSELGSKLPFSGKGHKVSDSPPTPDPPTISVPRSPEPHQDQQIPSPEIPGPAAPFEGFANPGTALCPPKESPTSSTRSSPDRSGNGTARINMTPPPLPADECIPLLPSEGARSRRTNLPRYEPTDWDDALPYGGKVYLARKKKPDSWPCIALQ
ncbi:vegetative cell wall protein gp1-like, partial [Hyalella azteca]|uniref:Vegetative cell wall protein gp1-like n=1 Tax=Hyalella azteca TaxID=294128 RepID=A0A8B7NY23_HYAAZ